jgi:hypothetical protein
VVASGYRWAGGGAGHCAALGLGGESDEGKQRTPHHCHHADVHARCPHGHPRPNRRPYAVPADKHTGSTYTHRGPGLENVRLKIVSDGAVLKVLDGPRESDGFTWWRLEEYVDGQPGVVGWAIDEYLEPTSAP